MVPAPGPRKFIAWGEMGIWQTLREMKRLAQVAAVDSEFYAFMDHICPGGRSKDETIKCLTDFTRAYVRYMDDPDEFEYVKDPLLMMRELKSQGFTEGDCDDYVTFISAMFSSYHIPHSIIALELPEFGEGFNHVVVGLPLGGHLYKNVDCTKKDGILEYQVKRTLRVDVI